MRERAERQFSVSSDFVGRRVEPMFHLRAEGPGQLGRDGGSGERAACAKRCKSDRERRSKEGNANHQNFHTV